MKNYAFLFRFCLVGMFVFALRHDGFADTNDALSVQILDVAAREGDSYMQGRKMLENLYRNKPQEFDELLKTTSDWRIQILVETVKERVTKADEITRFEETRMKFSDTRSWGRKIADVGDGMATHGKQTPMVLVEKIWKGNELHNYPLREPEGCSSVLYALGKMRVEKARPIVEDILTNDLYFTNRMEIIKGANRPAFAIDVVRQFSAITLAEFGDPKSVPALVRYLDKTMDSDDISTGAAADALIKCMNADSVSYVEKAMGPNKSERCNRVFTNIIKEYKKRSK